LVRIEGLEQALQRGNSQGFAEAARARQKIIFAFICHLINVTCLIHIKFVFFMNTF